jgi:hypothetical protein
MLAAAARRADAASTNPYPPAHNEYTASEKVLIVNTMVEDGGQQTIVWLSHARRSAPARVPGGHPAGLGQSGIAR